MGFSPVWDCLETSPSPNYSTLGKDGKAFCLYAPGYHKPTGTRVRGALSLLGGEGVPAPTAGPWGPGEEGGSQERGVVAGPGCSDSS